MGFRKFINNDNNEKVCICTRGLPGSGKSYKVRSLLVKYGGDENHVFSADKYFDSIAVEEFVKRYGRKPDLEGDAPILRGLYSHIWHPSKLGAAHNYCFDQFKTAVDQGITPVIVDNTNTQLRQIERYLKYAEQHGYRLRIEEPESPWWLDARSDLGNTKLKYSDKLQKLRDELTKHGQHGVPKDKIEQLIDDVWQNIPGSVNKFVTYDQIFSKV